jgi:hypothetical protein
MMKADDLVTVLGPFTSNWGTKTWRLLLGRKEIVAWPYTLREAARLGFGIETGFFSDPGLALETRDRDEFHKLLLGRSLRTYPVHKYSSISRAIDDDAVYILAYIQEVHLEADRQSVLEW